MCGRARTRVCVCVCIACVRGVYVFRCHQKTKAERVWEADQHVDGAKKEGREGVDGIWVRAVKVGHHEVVTRAWLHITGGIFLKTSTTAK